MGVDLRGDSHRADAAEKSLVSHPRQHLVDAAQPVGRVLLGPPAGPALHRNRLREGSEQATTPIEHGGLDRRGANINPQDQIAHPASRQPAAKRRVKKGASGSERASADRGTAAV
jgi:hypothetical protein